jgi:hypothetical protein
MNPRTPRVAAATTGGVHATDLFARDFRSARDRFLDAAEAARATVGSYAHPLDDTLSCDTAFLPGDGKWVLVTLSGVHGVEGFCGSAVQTNLLCRHRSGPMTGIAQFHVHAVNPWGMNSNSRADDGNVDLNRNVVDFTAPPVNEHYHEIHRALSFNAWTADELARFWAFHREFVGRVGLSGWNRAFSSGQHTAPDGVMYGGSRPAWGHTTLVAALRSLPDELTSAVVIDFHTGIGAFGEALLLPRRLPRAPPLRAALNALAPSSRLLDDRHSPLDVRRFSGLLVDACEARFPEDGLSLVVEYGTYPPTEMIEAILFDRWARYHDPAVERNHLHDLYTPRDPAWGRRVHAHAEAMVDSLISALTDGTDDARR